MLDADPRHDQNFDAEPALGLIATDRAHRVLWANATAARQLGTTPEALRGVDVRSGGIPFRAPTREEAMAWRFSQDGALLGLTQRCGAAPGESLLLVLIERRRAVSDLLGLMGRSATAVEPLGVLSFPAVRARLESEISRSRRYDDPLSCVGVRFVAGHSLAAYSALAGELRACLRWIDQVGFWDEDALIVVLPKTAAAGLRRVHLRIDGICSGAMRPWRSQAAVWCRGDTPEKLVERALPARGPVYADPSSVDG